MSPIWLASASPRRRQLLEWAGLEVEVHPSHVDETRRAGEPPAAWAQRLAAEKAEVGPASRLVVAADTVVHQAERVFDKPRDRAEGRSHLRALSGAWHGVTTGVCVRAGERSRAWAVTTRVRFRVLGESEIEAWLDTGEADDKAGAYGIQTRAGVFVASIDGDWTNVMGLPMESVLAEIAEIRGA